MTAAHTGTTASGHSVNLINQDNTWSVFSPKMMNFGKSRAKLSTDEHKKVNFTKVAGLKEEKEELEEIVDFLRSSFNVIISVPVGVSAFCSIMTEVTFPAVQFVVGYGMDYAQRYRNLPYIGVVEFE